MKQPLFSLFGLFSLLTAQGCAPEDPGSGASGALVPRGGEAATADGERPEALADRGAVSEVTGRFDPPSDTLDEAPAPTAGALPARPLDLFGLPGTGCTGDDADAAIIVDTVWQSVQGVGAARPTCGGYSVQLNRTRRRNVDLVVNFEPGAPVASTKTSCEASFLGHEVLGYRPAHSVTHEDGSTEPVEARWERLTSDRENGVWTDGACHFPRYELAGPEKRFGHQVLANSPFSAVRVVLRALDAASGLGLPMSVHARKS